MGSDDRHYAHAKKIARRKVEFIRHFITYIIVLAVLATINNLTYRGYQWWLWVALLWGIGVFVNFLIAYLFRGGGLKSIEEQLIRKEMERLKNEK
jgi:uncharacterized membrane protein YdbT with pleckstrin-like domain